jgi:predicted DNA-binding transcriptional regulator YafY
MGISESTGKPEKIELRLSTVAAKLVETQPLHSSQKKIKESKEGTVFQFELHPCQELYNFILSYGNEVEVLKPSSLRKEILRRLDLAMKNYK